MSSSVKRRKKDELTKEQIFMAKMIKRVKTILLAVDMGMGKTGATLTAVRRLLDEFMVRKVIVVAPVYVAENTWPEEIAAWEHTHGLSYSIVTGTPKQRIAALEREAELYIINRENVAWLYRYLGRKKWDFDMLVYDESSRLKGGRKRTSATKRMSEFGALAAMRFKMRYVVELSGTPSPNGLMDLWGQIYILDQGERLGEKKSHFEERWFNKDPYSYKVEPKAHAEKQIMRRVSDVMVSIEATGENAQPKPRMNIIKVPLPSKVMKEYKRFERTLVSDVYDVEAVSKGVLTNKLLQFANGSMYRNIEEEDRRELVRIHDAKLDALESVMNEANGAPVLLAYSFKFDVKRITKKFPKAVIAENEPDWKRLWDKGRIGLLLTHPASVGHGLNLQYGGHIQCWYGLSWSLELYQQFNKRLARRGQKHPFVMIHHILAKDTADETVYASLQQKGATQQRINEAVRRRILSL